MDDETTLQLYFPVPCYHTVQVYSKQPHFQFLPICSAHASSSSIVSGLIEDVIPMPPDTMSLEQFRESQAGRNLRFMYKLVSILRLADDEFAHLHQHH